MGTRKKKDRRKAKRTMILTSGVHGITVTPVGSQEELWEQIRALAEKLEAQSKEQLRFLGGEHALQLLEQNGHRRPIHLLPAAEMFSSLPELDSVRHWTRPIRTAWETYALHRGDPDAIDFIVEAMPPWSELGICWNEFCAYEQRYMETWAVLNAREAARTIGSAIPATKEQLKTALQEALGACQTSRHAQEEVDARSVFAYDTILVLRESGVSELLDELAEECDWFGYSWDDALEQGHLHFKEESGASGHTGTAAGYAAAVAVLREHGVACEQWSRWD